MPFIAECPFCSGKVRAPANSEGQSIQCPKCGDCFTLVPMLHPPEMPVTEPRPRSDPALRASEPRRDNTAPALPTPKVETPVLDTPVEPGQPREGPRTTTRIEITPQPRRRKRRGVNVLGLVSFLCGSVALLLASFPIVRLATIPLAGVGLLLGLIGLSANSGGMKILLPSVGTGVSLLTVLSGLWIGLLPFQISNPETKAPQTQQTVLQRGGKTTEVSDGEWINAQRGSILVQDVSVRLLSVRLAPLEMKDAKKQKAARDKKPVLQIAVRLGRIGFDQAIEYESWGEISKDKERAAPRLSDNQGKTYSRRFLTAGEELPGHIRKGVLLPGKQIEDVLVFEPPAAKIEFLHLELPAENVGGTGKLRIRIPQDMISR